MKNKQRTVTQSKTAVAEVQMSLQRCSQLSTELRSHERRVLPKGIGYLKLYRESNALQSIAR